MLEGAECVRVRIALPDDVESGNGHFYRFALIDRACDIDDYAAWTLKHLLRSPDFAWLAERADDWRKPWPGYTMTRYGRKAEREGRTPAYFRFRRVG